VRKDIHLEIGEKGDVIIDNQWSLDGERGGSSRRKWTSRNTKSGSRPTGLEAFHNLL
jgi:hypothetical protein